MSYQNYLELKKRGPTTRFLITDKGIKMFPVMFTNRKFIENNKNYFTQLNVAFDILIDINHYYTIGFYLVDSSHHKSHLKPHTKPRLVIRHDTLYEYGNEEEYLPAIKHLKMVHNEQDILNIIETSIKYYEKEQGISIWKAYLETWNKQKRKIKRTSLNQDYNDSLAHWKHFYKSLT